MIWLQDYLLNMTSTLGLSDFLKKKSAYFADIS